MAHSQLPDVGNGLQIRRLAANVLNKQLRTTDRGWSTNLRVQMRANNLAWDLDGL
jgi:hypothetical protein